MAAGITNFLIGWGPAILLALALLWGLAWGFIRGFRKNLILAINALVAALVCVIAYTIIVNMKGFDAWSFNLTNSIVSAFTGNTINDMLEISDECNTLTDCLIEFIPKNMDYGDGLKLILKDNGAYLATIVDLCYHIIFALVFYIIYLLLVFILYLIYFIFYPQRRYKKKIKEKYRNAEETEDYNRHPFFGALVGGIRSLVGFVVSISFVGIILFTVAGGTGEKEYQEYDFGTNNVNQGYEVFKSVGSYGSSGVFKVLNVVKDSNDFPYYLYLADLVFQGGLKDEERNIDTNISMAREFGSYIGFSRDALDLLLKYDDEKIIKSVISGNSNKNLMDGISKIMAKPEFQTEFSDIINNFKSEEYFINFSLSLMDSIVKNRNEFMKDIDSETKELFDIIFDGEYKITLSAILNRNDVNILLNTCIKMLAAGSEYGDLEDKTEVAVRKTIASIEVVINELRKLSLFNDESKKNNINGVLAELYEYFLDKIVTEENKTTDDLSAKVMKLSNVSIDEVDWINELNGLLDIGLNVINLYDRIYDPNKEVVDMLFDMFKGENAIENEADFDDIINTLSSSKLAGVVLSMSFVNDTLEEALGGFINDFELIPNIRYSNDGENKGEIYYLLTSIKQFIKVDAREVFNSLKVDGATTKDMLNSAKVLVETLESKVDKDTTLLDQMLKSDLLSYTLSSVLMNMDFGNEIMKIYIPNDSIYNIRETNEKEYKAIKTNDLTELVSSLPDVVDVITPAIDENDEIDIMIVLNDPNLSQVLKESVILEGTISNVALGMLKDFDGISIPNSLEKVDSWLSTETTDGEIVKIIDGINASGIDLNSLMNSASDTNDILELVLSLNEFVDGTNTKLDLLYESLVLRSTLTVQLDSTLNGMVDANVLNSTEVKYKTNDEFNDIYYKKEEIASVIDSIKILEIDSLATDDFNVDTLSGKVLSLNTVIAGTTQTKLDVLYSSTIIKFVLANTLDDTLTNDIVDSNVRNSTLVKAANNLVNVTSEIVSKATYYKQEEVKNVINSLKELDIESISSESLDTDTISNRVLTLNSVATTDTTKTKLDVLYSSVLVKFILTKGLDSALTGDIVSTTVRDSQFVKTTQSINNALDDTLSYAVFYNETEVESIIDSLKELDISSINSSQINVNAISDKVLSLNETATTDSEKTKLGVLYDSYLVKYILADALDDNVIDSLGINQAVINSVQANDEISTCKYYKLDEVKKLLDAVGANGLDITDFDEISSANANLIISKNVNEIPAGQSESRLSVIYKSNIIKDIITTKLDETLGGNEYIVLDPNVKDVEFNETIKFYNQNEIATLLDFMKKRASLDFEAINVSSLSLDSDDVELIVDSKILYATVSKFIIDNNTLVVPNESKELIANTTNKYNVETSNDCMEMKNILNGIISLCDGNVSQNIDLTLNETTIGVLCSSVILRATISNSVIDNSVVIVPIDTIDSTITSKKVIYASELNALLNAVSSALGVTSVSDFEATNIAIPTDDKLDTLANSMIMRATITNNIEATDGSNPLALFVENNSDYVVKTTSQNNTDILVLTKAEIVNIVNAIKIINGSSSTEFNISISVASLLAIYNSGEESVNKALQSSMVHLLIADFLKNYNSSLPTSPISLQYAYTPTVYHTFNIGTISENTAHSTMSKDNIKGFLNHIKTNASLIGIPV